MRYRPRITRAIALALLLSLVLYFYASDRVSANLRNQLSSLRSASKWSSDDQSIPESIQSLWALWSTNFYETRAKAGPIQLSSNANLISISSSDHGPRKAYGDHVVNSKSDIELLRSSHAALLHRLESLRFGDNIFNGTGVVMVGGGEYFGPAVIGLHMLRKTGSTLPVEIFVADESEHEAGICDDYLPKHGARCLVIAHFLQNGGIEQRFEVTHYQLKSLAMLFSSFAEVMYLDSDSIPLVDPSEFFSTEPYRSSGLVIWPDFWIATESPLFYAIAGMPFPSNLPKTSSEAGQLLVNKHTHLKTLLLAIYYNIFGPDYFYPLLSQGVLGQGDKETFMAAAIVTGQSYYRVKSGVATIGRHNGEEYKGSGMLQHHPSEDFAKKEDNSTTVRHAFVHANTPKMNAGHLVDEGDLFTVDQKRLRLWGPKNGQEELFGYDLEKTVWEVLVQTGCELEHVVKEWKGRERLCGRLEDHWKEVF